MVIKSHRETTVTITFSEREAMLLACLMGALRPDEAVDLVKRGLNFEVWIEQLKEREMIDFTGAIYDTLNELF